MELPFAKGCSYYLVGLGKSGRSAVQALLKSGAIVYVWDDQDRGQRYAMEKGLSLLRADQVPWGEVTALILSPGIPHEHPVPHESAFYARQNGVPIVCDVDLFFQAQPKGPVIGVTGTNGKSTTTALISHCLNEAGLTAQAAGNIGFPVLDVWGGDGSVIGGGPVVGDGSVIGGGPVVGDGSVITVLELSSYHLERTPHLALDVAIHLNLTPDHLTRHGGMEGYVNAKKSIFSKVKLALVGADDASSQAIYDSLRVSSKTGEFKKAGEFKKGSESKKAFSGKQSLTAGLFYQQGSFFEKADAEGSAQPLFTDEILPPSLHGPHNAQNILAAYGACQYLGVSLESFMKGLKSFKGLPHRQEVIGIKEGVTFVNDSKATNAVSTAQALQTFEDIFWIVGGQPKGEGLTDLAPFFPKLRKVYLIGEATNIFAEELGRADPRVVFEKCHTLEKAFTVVCRDVQQYLEQHKKGVVLLSPACASFDQFQSFEERGDVFRNLVLSLGQESLRKIQGKEIEAQ